MTQPPPAIDEYALFCRTMHARTQIDLLAYKRHQMERRIRSMSERVGMATLTDYWHFLRGHPEALRDFLDHVTINVSEFFRNPERFEEMRLRVLPSLLKEQRRVAVWSAGCSHGAEPYSMSILLHQLSPTGTHSILATDIDEGILGHAREGIYDQADIKNVSELHKRRYFTMQDGKARIADLCKQMITFRRHDLIHDAYPRQIDMILCRNVVIYFNDETKDRIFAKFYEALRPGGYLLIGSTEHIRNAVPIGFTNPLPFWYQKK